MANWKVDKMMRRLFKIGNKYSALAFATFLIMMGLTGVLNDAGGQGAATFSPPHYDYGLDTNADTLYNYLVVNANITVTVPGTFYVQISLTDSSGTIWITSNWNASFLEVGFRTLPVRLNGMDIYNSGINGPYNATLSLYNDTFVLLDTNVHVTNPYSYNQFQPPPAKFLPPHSDYVPDVDADGLYNFLVVNVSINVSSAGFFRIEGRLTDAAGITFIDFQSNYTNLGVGAQIIQLRFFGFRIRSSMINGPYLVTLYLYDVDWNSLDTGTHTTKAYSWNQFETVPAEFAPPYSDYGLDTNANGLFEYLVVNASVNVSEAGYYSITSSLYDASGFFWIGYDDNYTHLSTGYHVVKLFFMGFQIRSSAINGPYRVELYLSYQYEESLIMIDNDTYLTNSYLWEQFEFPPAQFYPPYSDYGLDRDTPPDGLFNVLVVNSSLNVSVNGSYLIWARLPYGEGAITETFKMVSLNQGIWTVPLWFSGVDIFNSGINGPYTVEMYLLYWAIDQWVMIDYDTYQTSPYLYTQFQSTTPQSIFGYITDFQSNPIMNAQINVVNYTNSFYREVSTNESGYYSINAFEGDFVVTADYEGLQSKLAFTSVLGATEVSMTLPPTPPNDSIMNISFLNWDNMDFNFSMKLNEDNETLRFLLDWWLGNRDGYLDQGEIDSFLQFVGMKVPSNTIEQLYLDNIYYNLVPGSDNVNVVAQGPVTSKDPIYFKMFASYLSNTTIPPSDIHFMELNASYDDQEDTNILYVKLPLGNVLLLFEPATNVSISGLDTRIITIDPLGDPNPLDQVDYVWVNLTVGIPDTTPPTITNVVAIPDPQEVYGNVNISAIITDNLQVSGAWVNVTNPSGGTVGNFTMIYDSVTARYYWNTSYNFVGTYTFTIWAVDVKNNSASSTSQLSILDSTKPMITDVVTSPSPQEIFGNVNITANVTDNYQLIGVWVYITDPNDNFVGNFSMGYDEAAGKYFHEDMYGILGTYNFTIWAKDSSDNWASAQGRFLIQDTTNPIANAGPDQQVIQGTLVIFDGSASTDNSGLITNYTWTFIDGATVTLYGVNPTYRFNNVGNFNVTLTVKDPSGNSDTDVIWVNVTELVVPKPPSGLTVSDPTQTTLNLSWTAPTENTNGSPLTDLAGYNVYRGTASGGPYAKVNTDLVTTTSFQDTGLTQGRTYYYVVTAVNEEGLESDYSEENSGRTLSPKTGSLLGRVVGEDVKPIEGAKVEVIDNDRRVATDFSEENGAFVLRDISAGNYTLVISKEGYETYQRDVTVFAGIETDIGQIILKQIKTEEPFPWFVLFLLLTLVTIVTLVTLSLFILIRRKKR